MPIDITVPKDNDLISTFPAAIREARTVVAESAAGNIPVLQITVEYPIGDVTVISAEELVSLVGVTASVQAQIDSKEPTKGVDDNYVTDAEKTKLSNLSGTNTGDQDLSGYSLTTHNHTLNNLAEKSYNSLTDKPTIPSISGLLDETTHDALDHTGLTGIPTQYTDEMAQDAIGTLITNGTQTGITVAYDDATNKIDFTVTASGAGDVTGPVSATDGNIVLFDGATGKVMKNSTVSPTSFAAALGVDDNYVTDAEKANLHAPHSDDQDLSGLLDETSHDLLDHTGLTGIPTAYTLPTASNTVLGGVKVDGTTVLISDGVISSTGGSGGGVTDHGLLTGLADDDHSQYLNETRHDALDHTGLTGILALGTTSATAAYGDHNHTGVYQPVGTYSTDIHSNITALNAVSGTNTGDQNLSGYSLITHNHSLNNLTEKSYDSLTDKPTIPSITGLLDETAHDVLDHTGLTGVLALGTTSTTACAGNDARLSDSRPASDVSAWAKSATKPTYTYTEVGAAPSLGTDDNYVTDAEKVKLANLSGVNSGDQDLSALNAHLTNTSDPHDTQWDQLGGTLTKLPLNTSLASQTLAAGEMAWNPDERCFDMGINGVTLQSGQEIVANVRNSTGSTISNGTVCMAVGTIGASGRITIAPMDGTNPANALRLLGIATEDIPAGQDGFVTSFGKVRGVNTSAYSEGDILYTSTTVAGALTATPPAAGLKQPIAYVITDHASVGALFVRIETLNHLAFDPVGTAAGLLTTHSESGDHDERYYTETEVNNLLHDAVTISDTMSINLSLTGQALSANAIFGTTSGTVAQGNDSRFVTNGDTHDHSGGDGGQIAYSSLSGTPNPSDYAVAAKGVTNGDSHDHSGGDGGTIAYSSLSGAPSSFEPSDGDKGDITVSGSGAIWAINDGDVTNTKLASDVFSTDREWSGSQRGAVVTDNDGSFDMNVGQNFLCTPSAGFTLTFTNITAGQSGFITLINNSAYTVAKASYVKCGASMLATISATGRYKLNYDSPDGTNVDITASGALS